ADPDTIIRLATEIKTLRTENQQHKILNSELTVKNHIMAPKADYFDQIVDRNLLTNFRVTAKQFDVREKDFIGFLLEKKYIYRDKHGKLMPTAEKNNGLFEIKECINEKTRWSGTQTFITPKGRETFRLLCRGL
ncbi:MAG: phage antirepressor KilAC domain-containing protein, partial [Christensenellales bacterium]